MSVFQLLYASGAARPLENADLDQILMASRANNAAAGVTGMLLFSGEAFLQVLEGDRATVRALAGRIRKDPRHRNFMILVEQSAGERAFGGWDMGYKHLDRSRAVEGPLFEASQAAVAGRITPEHCGPMLDMVLAFGRDFMAEA